MTASIIINNVNESITEQQFIKLDDYHAYGKEDRCVYQIIEESDLENPQLVFKAEDGTCYNYAEDGDVDAFAKKHDINLTAIDFEQNKELIIEKTLEQIPNALRGDRVNRHFYFQDGEVDYSISAGQIILGEKYFFSIKDHETPDAGDYGYESDDDMLDDTQFIDDQYRDQVTEAIENYA